MSEKPVWYAFDNSAFVPGVTGEFTSPRGIKVATKSWAPPAEALAEDGRPVGAVLFCHGFVRPLAHPGVRCVDCTHPLLPPCVQGHRVTDDEMYDLVADKLCRAGFACYGE